MVHRTEIMYNTISDCTNRVRTWTNRVRTMILAMTD